MNSNHSNKNVVIAGGGFFGLCLAEDLNRKGISVTLYEKSPELMSRASYVNQARVHNGYHYPRSILTAMRSRISFPRFIEEFSECVESDFEKYYLIATPLGKVTSEQFSRFCQRINAYCEPAPSRIKKLVNPGLIEEVFSTTEFAFDAYKLRDLMLRRLEGTSVKIITDATVERVRPQNNGLLVDVCIGSEKGQVYADHLFNCTYSRINYLLNNSGVELIPLKHEMTEMCLVEPPEHLKKMGLTVMCGPFFSMMPFPSAKRHSFSHVRYTPHYEWSDNAIGSYVDAHQIHDRAERHTAWRYMVSDAARYIPSLAECEYDRSIWEVKTILPRSDTDDSRPILFRANHGLKGLHCIMGGKIDNVFDVIEEINRLIDWE